MVYIYYPSMYSDCFFTDSFLIIFVNVLDKHVVKITYSASHSIAFLLCYTNSMSLFYNLEHFTI